MTSQPGDFKKSLHPGAGRRHATPFPKGRTVDSGSLAEIRALLADRPRRRDLLIEHLHLIQDQFGRVRDDHIIALASEMALAPVEVFEVATFYAHFDVVQEGEPDPPPITVRVCDGLTCSLFGEELLRHDLERSLGPEA